MASNQDAKTALGESSDPHPPPMSPSPVSPANSETPFVSRDGTLKAHSANGGHCDEDPNAMPFSRGTLWERFKHFLGWHSSKWDWNIDVPQYNPSLDHHPNGYAKVAAFQDSDPSFLIFRKFGWLHNCILLDIQDELQVLEWELEQHNEQEANIGDPDRLTSRRMDYENPLSRSALITKIKDKLAEYDEILLRTQQIQAIRRPSKTYQNSVYNYLQLHQKISEEEIDWIKQRGDLAAVSRDAEHGWPNSFLERHLRKLSPTLLLRIFQTKEQEETSRHSEGLHLISNYRVNNVVRATVTVIASTQLLLAVYILFRLAPTNPSEVQRSGNFQILVIFIFTLLFSATCSIFTKASSQEVFAATAAYCAVLVVFLGNSTSNMISNTNGPG